MPKILYRLIPVFDEDLRTDAERERDEAAEREKWAKWMEEQVANARKKAP